MGTKGGLGRALPQLLPPEAEGGPGPSIAQGWNHLSESNALVLETEGRELVSCHHPGDRVLTACPHLQLTRGHRVTLGVGAERVLCVL